MARFYEIPTGLKPDQILKDFFCPYCYNTKYKCVIKSDYKLYICDRCNGIRLQVTLSEGWIEFSYPKYVL